MILVFLTKKNQVPDTFLKTCTIACLSSPFLKMEKINVFHCGITEVSKKHIPEWLKTIFNSRRSRQK